MQTDQGPTDAKKRRFEFAEIRIVAEPEPDVESDAESVAKADEQAKRRYAEAVEALYDAKTLAEFVGQLGAVTSAPYKELKYHRTKKTAAFCDACDMFAGQLVHFGSGDEASELKELVKKNVSSHRWVSEALGGLYRARLFLDPAAFEAARSRVDSLRRARALECCIFNARLHALKR